MFKTFSAAAVLFLSAEAVRMQADPVVVDDAVADVADVKLTVEEKLVKCRTWKKKINLD